LANALHRVLRENPLSDEKYLKYDDPKNEQSAIREERFRTLNKSPHPTGQAYSLLPDIRISALPPRANHQTASGAKLTV
jgi:hypothetical protein